MKVRSNVMKGPAVSLHGEVEGAETSFLEDILLQQREGWGERKLWSLDQGEVVLSSLPFLTRQSFSISEAQCGISFLYPPHNAKRGYVKYS